LPRVTNPPSRDSRSEGLMIPDRPRLIHGNDRAYPSAAPALLPVLFHRRDPGAPGEPVEAAGPPLLQRQAVTGADPDRRDDHDQDQSQEEQLAELDRTVEVDVISGRRPDPAASEPEKERQRDARDRDRQAQGEP